MQTILEDDTIIFKGDPELGVTGCKNRQIGDISKQLYEIILNYLDRHTTLNKVLSLSHIHVPTIARTCTCNDSLCDVHTLQWVPPIVIPSVYAKFMIISGIFHKMGYNVWGNGFGFPLFMIINGILY